MFYLSAFENCKYALSVIWDPPNQARRILHADFGPALRIGLGQTLKNAPYLVQFGRHERNDVILNDHFSRNDFCYFDFNKETGERMCFCKVEPGRAEEKISFANNSTRFSTL